MASGSRFDSLLNQVQTRIDQLESMHAEYPQYNLQQKKYCVTSGIKDLNQCQGYLSEMEKLLLSMPMRDRNFFSDDVSSVKNDINRLRDIYEKYETEVKREVLLEEAQKNQGLDLDTVQRTNANLKNANKNLDDALNIGQGILESQDKVKETIVDDRKHLENIDNNVDGVIGEADIASHRLREMAKTACLNGTCSWFFTVVLVIVDVGILLVCFFPKQIGLSS